MPPLFDINYPFYKQFFMENWITMHPLYAKFNVHLSKITIYDPVIPNESYTAIGGGNQPRYLASRFVTDTFYLIQHKT